MESVPVFEYPAPMTSTILDASGFDGAPPIVPLLFRLASGKLIYYAGVPFWSPR